MLISDYSRRYGSWGLPRVGSYLVLSPGRREFSVGKCTQLRMLPVVSTQGATNGYWDSRLLARSPAPLSLLDASLFVQAHTSP
jgi:hypothetical protein